MDLPALQVQWYHQCLALFKRADLVWKTAYPAEITPLIPHTKVYRVLIRKPEGRRPLGRPRRRWEDYIKMDVQKRGVGGLGLDCSDSREGQVVGACECSNEPSNSIKSGEFLD